MKVIVVGGGTSGLMASVSAALAGAEVILLDKNPSLGRKLLLTGGTRCNVTNIRSRDEIIKHIPGNGRFLHSAFSQFDNQDIIEFFQNRGVKLKEEDHGRMFPVSDSAKTILNTFIEEIKRLGIQVRINVKVKETFIKEGVLRALSLRNVALSVLNKKGKAVVTHQMDMIFTHFGISGPAVLRCSSFVHQVQQKDNVSEVTMSLNIQPDLTKQELVEQWQEWKENSPQKTVKTPLKEWMPERYAEFLLQQIGLSSQKVIGKMTDQEVQQLLNSIQDFRFTVGGSLPIEKGFVTGGGVQLKEVDPKTLESKITQGVYFCGELLDINGYTGGYNITAAFVTGYVAGLHAAQGW